MMLLLTGAEGVGMLYMDMSTTSSWGIPRCLATTADLLLALILLSRTLLHALAGHFPCRLAGEGQLLKTRSRLIQHPRSATVVHALLVELQEAGSD